MKTVGMCHLTDKNWDLEFSFMTEKVHPNVKKFRLSVVKLEGIVKRISKIDPQN